MSTKKSRKQQKSDDDECDDEDSWEDDENLKKKQMRKEEQAKKRELQVARKAETKRLLEEEGKRLKSRTPEVSKVTRDQIRSKVVTVKHQSGVRSGDDLGELKNVNRREEEVARSVEEALDLFGDGGVDRHPEKRQKVAFLAFQSRRIRELRIENPKLRLSQIKDVVAKEWQRSGENPMNQR